MLYPKSAAARISERIREIESRKPHPYAAATYKDIPALREIGEITEGLLRLSDRGALLDGIIAARYLRDSYESMWRIAYTAEYDKKLLNLQADLFRRFGARDGDRRDDYYKALRARNYYGRDTCEDLRQTAAVFLSEDERGRIEKQIFSDFHPLKHDPVELTEAYLSVIDEVERRMDTEEIQKMHGFQRSALFARLLKEYGVEWQSMTALNPGVYFD
ncbi:MAG: hypothetical protein IJD59_03260 [Clostridia bacterium]|nr:hypothetical protein [Clostridia bacterium]